MNNTIEKIIKVWKKKYVKKIGKTYTCVVADDKEMESWLRSQLQKIKDEAKREAMENL